MPFWTPPEAIAEHGHREICAAVHEEGAAIVLQILHAGRYAEVPECVGPSAAKAPIKRYAPPRVLATAEIWEIIEQYVTTARLAQQAGYDGGGDHGLGGVPDQRVPLGAHQ